MTNNLHFEFLVDKGKNTIQVIREFDANLDLVWQAWTRPELLDQWWAPKPYRTQTKNQEFREGGTWLYSMISPTDERHWCKAVYQKIEPAKLLCWLDAFCDENGVENTIKPPSYWTNTFTENKGITTVAITLQQESFEALEMMISMGFKEGFTMAMGNLDELISTIKNNS